MISIPRSDIIRAVAKQAFHSRGVKTITLCAILAELRRHGFDGVSVGELQAAGFEVHEEGEKR